ncbi:hypothetical protein MKZ38_004638 [Zalerion maritima]|uniref:Uncharacterized protein n=1 Tax=Zalerion maritima TaxID=339359 RepID=A0AAD5WQX7_9PEZI|nr:hypothetical protein MKZ38_004638 [Zalerion maritima]
MITLSLILLMIADNLGDERADFFVVAVYHACLCLWTYGRLAEMTGEEEEGEGKEDGMSRLAVGSGLPGASGMSSLPDIQVDGPESLQSQRWISHGRGIPVISGSGSMMPGDSLNNGEEVFRLVPLITSPRRRREDSFIHNVIELLGRTFCTPGTFVPILENVCQILRALDGLETG